ncbi:MAG: SUMF1/EgtB/PvdO family nonheme iron enzyme [Thermoanaerobaculia bacterium]
MNFAKRRPKGASFCGRDLARAGILLAAALLAAGAAKADTGTSDLFTIDLRTSLASTIRLERIDDARSPLLLEVRPGDEVHLYFAMRKATGEALAAATFEYAVKLSGATVAEAGSLAWTVDRPGVARLTLKADGLAFSAKPARLVFPQGSGWAKADGSPVTIENSLPDVSLSRLASPYRDLYVVYAEGSEGTSGLIGRGPGATSTTASLDAARLSVQGSAGVGLAMEVGPDGNLALERRASLIPAATLEVPTPELTSDVPFDASGPSIAVGGERGGGLGQRLEYAAADVLTDEGRVTNAAFFLETASLAGALVPSPFVGIFQRAAAETALRLAGAADLLRAAKREEWAGAALGGSLPAQALSVQGPVASSGAASTTPLRLSVASLDGIVATRTALLLSSSAGSSSHARENGWDVALSGSAEPATWSGTLREIFGPTWNDGYSFSTSVLARLGADGTLQEAGVGLGAQATPEGDLALFRTRDHDGFDVGMRLSSASILEALRLEGPSQLGALAGDAGAVLNLTRDEALSTAGYILDRAEALAPAGTVAFVAGADRRNARVQTGEFDLGLESGLLVGGDPAIAFSGGWEQARVVERARQTCRSDGESWDLRENSTAASWEGAPSLEELLSGRFFAGVGPLLEGALRGLLGSASRVLAPAAASAVDRRLAIEPLGVDDPTTGRRGGQAEFPASFDGMTATLQTGDPARPEATARSASGAASVRRSLTTRRVFAAIPPSRQAAMALAAASATQLTLVGNFLSLEAKPEGGLPVDPLPAAVNLTVDLYADQAARMGADPARLPEARLFRYDAGSGSWQLVGGSVAAGSSSVSASVTRPGTYAPGLLATIAPGDSDGDGLLDSEEDVNGNGIVDAGESDPWARDSDGDGVDDAEERRAGTDPMVAASVPNRKPVLGYVGNRKLHVGEALRLTLRCADPDGDPVTFSAQGLPAGASLDASTGAFAFTPTAAGTWRIAFAATDAPRSGTPLSDTKTVVLEAQRVAADGELTTRTRVVPVVLDARGANGSHYTTELTLTNRGTTPVSMTLRYQASIGDPTGSGATADTLAPGEQRVVPDTFSYLRSLGLPVPETAVAGSQIGVLLVKFEGAESEGAVAATARTTTATAPPQPAGAAGLACPGAPPDDASDSSLTVYGLRDDADDRSNVAVFNPAPDPVTVRVTAFSGDATGFSTVLRDGLTLPGFGWAQLSGVFSGTGISNGWVTIQRTSASGRFGAYGVVNDNTTNDGSYVPPTASTLSGTRLTVPVLVETAAYLSELVLANRSSSTATLTLRYVEGLTPSLGPGGTATVQLRPHEQQVIPEAIEYLRRHGIAIGTKGSGDFAGALGVTVAGAGLADVFAGARTASPSPAGGQYGLFTPGTAEGDAAREEAWVYGLRADSASRSNLAVVNAGADADGPVTLEIQVFDGDRGGVPAGSPQALALSPGQWAQATGILGPLGVRSGWVRVRRLSGAGTWLAYGVVVDGSSPGERTGDGSYVPMSTAEGGEITVTLPGGVPLVLVRIPAGTFQMGAPADERGTSAVEQPVHTVTLTQDFYVGKYEVTQAQWKAVMGTNPSLFAACGDACPVEQVTWDMVRGTDGFLAKLNALLGTTKFRLPTEAEWERAARGGTQTRFSFGDALDGDDACGANDAAVPFEWWCGTSASSPHPVGTKKANAFGLFDVHGNVWEMVEDWLGAYPSADQTDPAGPTTGSVRAVRGGGWFQLLRSTRSASRYLDSPELGYGVVGFRLARSK